MTKAVDSFHRPSRDQSAADGLSQGVLSMSSVLVTLVYVFLLNDDELRHCRHTPDCDAIDCSTWWYFPVYKAPWEMSREVSRVISTKHESHHLVQHFRIRHLALRHRRLSLFSLHPPPLFATWYNLVCLQRKQFPPLFTYFTNDISIIFFAYVNSVGLLKVSKPTQAQGELLIYLNSNSPNTWFKRFLIVLQKN